MKRKRLIALITAVTLTAIALPNLNWKSDSSLVAEASDFVPIDYTKPENQTLSEEELELMHEDNWLNQEVVKQVKSKSGHSLDQLDLNDFLSIKKLTKTYNSGITELPESIKFLSNLTKLNLSHLGLSSIPDSVGNLTKLTSLNLYSNRLTLLPNSIDNLTSLTSLNLGSNRLTSIPDSVVNLTNLNSLDLNSNQLTSIPDSIFNLTNLTSLDIRRNNLTSISDSIGNLEKLTKLDLGENKLTEIPESLGNLKNLTELRLGSNKLSQLPTSLGNLTNLTCLDLSSNKLTDSIDISKFTKPNVLIEVNDNYLTKIPEHSPNASLLTNPNCIMDESESNQYGLNEEDLGPVFENNAIRTRVMKIGDSFDLSKFHLGLMTYYKNYGQMFGINFVDSDPEQKSIVEDLKISSSNTEVVDNNGVAKSLGSCRVIVYLPGGEDGSKFSISRVYDVTVCNPVAKFISSPSKNDISGALDELDSKKDSGEDITATKDEVINKGKEYVSNSEVSKQDKYDYIDKIIDNLADADKKVVERTDVVETIKELPKEDRKPPIDNLVDKTQDTSGTFIQGGNQFATKGLGITLKVGEKLDLSKAVEVTYNGVKIDDSKLSNLSLPDITTEKFNEYFDENKIAIKKGSLTSKIRLTAEYDPNETENKLKAPSLKAGLMKAFGLNDENVVSNPAETEPVTINIIQPVVSSGETTTSGDVEVKYNLNETAQLILSSDSVTFGSNTGLAEVEQDGTLTATVKSSTAYDLDLTPKSNLVNQADSSIEIPSTKANVKIADGEFKVLPEPNATINLVSGEEKTTDLEGRKKDYNLKFKIDEIIGSKSGTYKMPVRITLTQK